MTKLTNAIKNRDIATALKLIQGNGLSGWFWRWWGILEQLDSDDQPYDYVSLTPIGLAFEYDIPVIINALLDAGVSIELGKFENHNQRLPIHIPATISYDNNRQGTFPKYPLLEYLKKAYAHDPENSQSRLQIIKRVLDTKQFRINATDLCYDFLCCMNLCLPDVSNAHIYVIVDFLLACDNVDINRIFPGSNLRFSPRCLLAIALEKHDQILAMKLLRKGANIFVHDDGDGLFSKELCLNDEQILTTLSIADTNNIHLDLEQMLSNLPNKLQTISRSLIAKHNKKKLVLSAKLLTWSNVNNNALADEYAKLLAIEPNFANYSYPENLTCPITRTLITDHPVTIKGSRCKRAYSKAAIQLWFSHNNTDPATREVLNDKQKQLVVDLETQNKIIAELRRLQAQASQHETQQSAIKFSSRLKG